MRHGGRTTLARAVFPIAQPQSPRPCVFHPPAPPAKPASRQGLALTTPHALARIRRPSLPNDPNGRYASRTRPRTAHPYPCRVRHSQAPLSRRPALPGRDRKRLCPHSCPVHPFADPPPPTCASPARPKTACPPSCRVRHSQAPLPRRPALPLRDRKRLVRALAAFAHRRPAPRRPALPRATANRLPTLLPRPPFAGPLPRRPALLPPTRPRTFPRAVSRKRRATACALPAWLWLSRRAMWGKKCSSFTIR